MEYVTPGPVEENWSEAISPVEEIINEARNGRMFILVDHEDRENEGDLVIPAQMATPDAINFMATHGRGLICLSLTGERVDALGLPPMVTNNSSRTETPFTVSIEAREGVTTGISAADRARTIAVAIDASKGAQDIATPGHVFPLRAREGGVLVRAGHTEAAVDVSRLAGLNPAAYIGQGTSLGGPLIQADDPSALAAILEGGMAEAVIGGALLRIRQDGIGFRDLLEAGRSLLAAVVAVRVVLHGQLAIGGLQPGGIDRTFNAQNLVIIALRHLAVVLIIPFRSGRPSWVEAVRKPIPRQTWVSGRLMQVS